VDTAPPEPPDRLLLAEGANGQGNAVDSLDAIPSKVYCKSE
jgi:hypothetical protein